MRRKPVFLVAAIAETIRFLALAFLAYTIGALATSSVSGVLRYAAAPQILFAAGFFFLWLDRERYGSYRPLLLLGKAACLVCLFPMARAVAGDPQAIGIAFGRPAFGLSLTLLVAAEDILALALLLFAKSEGAGKAVEPAAKPSEAGQGPDDIERVEA
jgi:hypothetical protein